MTDTVQLRCDKRAWLILDPTTQRWQPLEASRAGTPGRHASPAHLRRAVAEWSRAHGFRLPKGFTVEVVEPEPTRPLQERVPDELATGARSIARGFGRLVLEHRRQPVVDLVVGGVRVPVEVGGADPAAELRERTDEAYAAEAMEQEPS